ncbi:MAG: U32 family peptidase [Gammaproteobacteria bacterium CG22_combo_CG10-13_8_21_14_all_40_8]|nr:MAG: U32 family peptidase [Gammaproteobacteria bacterium CG22_combo_CG10-13_8_21_14_all_40_8]
MAMKISLAPVSYHWSAKRLFDFYNRVTTLPIDRVYLGESICSKRRELKLDDWLGIALKLKEAGKEVVLSNLALIEARSEVALMKKICQQGYSIEANDWSAVEIATQLGTPFYAGPSLNIYHGKTLALLYHQNLKGWTLPVELSGDDLSALLAHFNELVNSQDRPLDCEVFSYGFAPLAYSARCFSAHADNVAKDDCRQRCIQDEEGILLHSQEREALFRINGIQTQSAACYNLLPYWQNIQKKGANYLRISPTAADISPLIIQLNQSIQHNEIYATPSNEPPLDYCNGYWFNIPGFQQTSY